jgi:phage baseplate assembly protein W
MIYYTGTRRYTLTQYVAKKIYSVTGYLNSVPYTFAQNTDYMLDNNTLVWSSLSTTKKPDNKSIVSVIYLYDPIQTDIPFTEDQLGKDWRVMQATNNMTPSPKGDISVIEFKDNFVQSIRHVLLTAKGESFKNPNYGSELYKLIGQPMVESTIELARLYVVDAINQNPRVDKILNVTITPDRLNSLLKISVTLTSIVSREPLNIVFDYYLDKEGYIYL